MADQERWFTPQELGQMSRPTMDRAIEALEAGDAETALQLRKAMRHEWRFLHDLMAESMLGLVTWVTERAHEWSYGRESFNRDLCTWHRYEDPGDTPDEHWRRYGFTRVGA